MDRKDIKLFIHCRECVSEKPIDISASEYSRLEIGLTEECLLIWCKRHNREVSFYEVRGAKGGFDSLIECGCEGCR